MNILILGGTGFIGSAMARSLVAAGHSVTVFSRGQTKGDLPAGIERLTGNRDTLQGLQALTGRNWDTCIDSGYLPQQVKLTGKLLQNAVQHYVFISAVAAYGNTPGPLSETSPTPRLSQTEQAAVQSQDDLDNRSYGPSKVACEDVLHTLYPQRLTVLRPQVVVGLGDPTKRYTTWAAQAGSSKVLFAGEGSDYLQVIDVRDIAAFTVLLIQNRITGTYNLAGPRLTWAEFATLLDVKQPVWVPVTELAARGLTLAQFPLFRPTGSERSAWMNVSSLKAQRVGLQLTPAAQTLADVRRSLGNQSMPRPKW